MLSKTQPKEPRKKLASISKKKVDDDWKQAFDPNAKNEVQALRATMKIQKKKDRLS